MSAEDDLEELVHLLSSLSETSKYFADDFNGKDPGSRKQATYLVDETLEVPSFTPELDSLNIDLYVPKYTITETLYQGLEQKLEGEKVKELYAAYKDLLRLDAKIVPVLEIFKALYEDMNVKSDSKNMLFYEKERAMFYFSEESDYQSLFSIAVDAFFKFNTEYKQLKEKGVLLGDEPRLTVKLNLDPIIQQVVEYDTTLKSVLRLDKIPKKRLKPYNEIKHYVYRILQNYTFLRESGFVELFKDGVNLLEPEHRKLSKAFASVMYAISKYIK